MATVILSGIMILGMGIGVIKPSIDGFTKSKEIEDQIDEVTKTTDSLKERFNKINANIDKIDLELTNKITEDFKILQQIQSQINITTQELNRTEKIIQMIGIIFVTIIFFILLIQEFNLLNFTKKKT
jgi:uncharacterized membrane protein